MKLSELIDLLTKMRAEERRHRVFLDSLSHTWAPSPKVIERNGSKIVLLNN